MKPVKQFPERTGNITLVVSGVILLKPIIPVVPKYLSTFIPTIIPSLKLAAEMKRLLRSLRAKLLI